MIIKSLDHLKLFVKKFGNRLIKCNCIYLYGEIGAGKTTLVKSLINSLQEKNMIKKTQVPSPTFNILYEYKIKNKKILHYDLYRLKDKKEVDQLGIFKEKNNSIKIIEWPQKIREKIKDKIKIFLKYRRKENERDIKIVGYGKWKKLKIDEI